MLAPFVGELDRVAPSFRINGSRVKVLETPTEFYETLKVGSHAPMTWTRDTIG
jgi:CDP-diacylglycerol--glycerol-3-phosphate 3-phosphatidyltransferase